MGRGLHLPLGVGNDGGGHFEHWNSGHSVYDCLHNCFPILIRANRVYAPLGNLHRHRSRYCKLDFVRRRGAYKFPHKLPG